MSKLIITVSLLLALLGGCADDHCGSGIHNGWDLLSTMPYEKPVKYIDMKDAILFADGNLLQFEWKRRGVEHDSLFPLNEICNSDTICDVVFYDQALRSRNYGSLYNPVRITEEQFILIVTPSKCCKLTPDFSFLIEFGNSGADSTRLISAQSVDIDYDGTVYVTDSGDNSVKIYDCNGNFSYSWTNIGSPDRLKLFNNLIYIADFSENTITAYDRERQFRSQIIDPLFYSQMTAFAIDDGYVWVADLGGTRITRSPFSGDPEEVKYDFCYKDVIFTFEKVTNLVADEFLDNLQVIATDMNANCIADLRYVTYE